MVIQIIDIDDVTIFEPKRYTPVARDGDRMVSPHTTLEGVQSKAWDIHSLRTGGAVQGREDAQQFLHMLPSDLWRTALLIELSQAAMPKCPNHLSSV